MILSKHFTLEELVHSDTAIAKGIDNTPYQVAIDNLGRLARLVLEEIRVVVNVPIIISSGYRCAELNKLVGGVPTSDHVKGLAADINAQGMTNEELFNKILGMKDFIYSQCILENLDGRKWVHISVGIKRQNMRTDSRDENGKPIYITV